MAAEVVIEVGAVDIDFAANLGEGDDALVEFVVERELFGLERGVGGRKHSMLTSTNTTAIAMKDFVRIKRLLLSLVGLLY